MLTSEFILRFKTHFSPKPYKSPHELSIMSNVGNQTSTLCILGQACCSKNYVTSRSTRLILDWFELIFICYLSSLEFERKKNITQNTLIIHHEKSGWDFGIWGASVGGLPPSQCPFSIQDSYAGIIYLHGSQVTCWWSFLARGFTTGKDERCDIYIESQMMALERGLISSRATLGTFQTWKTDLCWLLDWRLNEKTLSNSHNGISFRNAALTLVTGFYTYNLNWCAGFLNHQSNHRLTKHIHSSKHRKICFQTLVNLWFQIDFLGPVRTPAAEKCESYLGGGLTFFQAKYDNGKHLPSTKKNHPKELRKKIWVFP